MLGQLDDVKRATRLPSDNQESDSHHSFSLALIAYDICTKYCPELNLEKVLLLALAHDLLELVTGDEDTLHYTAEQMEQKQRREEAASVEFEKLFANYPELKNAVHEYERLDTSEAAAVFVLDKACTTWTHFHDGGKYARSERGLKNRSDIEDWAERARTKTVARLNVQPPQAILDVFEASFEQLANLYKT
jgi:putative hydrolase of HD superfamily